MPTHSLALSDAISQRKSCETQNHINVQLHIFPQPKPELTVFWHTAVISLHPSPKSLFHQPAPSVCLGPWVGMVTFSPGVVWHGNLLSPICFSSSMTWALWLHSPGHYPLMHPHPSVKDHRQACQMGTGVLKWAGLPPSITAVEQGDFQKKKKKGRKFKIDQRKCILYRVLSHDINVMGWRLDVLSQSCSSWRPREIFLMKTKILEGLKCCKSLTIFCWNAANVTS